MKRACIFLCSLLVYGLSYATNLQPMNCTGSSTVTGPLGSTTVTGYGTTVPTGSGDVTCNACFYAGHLYVGNSYVDWYDTFSANGTQRIMYSDEPLVYPGSILNNRFTWGNDMTETFNIVNSVGWTLDNTVTPNIYWKVFAPSATNIKYTESGAGKGMSLNTVGSSAVPADRSIAGYAVTFDAASRTYSTSPEVVGNLDHHIQCSFVYPRWCGDGVIDTDKSEQCDNGASNGTAGNACNATCQNVVAQPSVCESLTLTPTTALINTPVNFTCTATNVTSGTTYNITKNDISVGTLPTGTLNFPTAATYTIKCIVNGNTPTPAACVKTITVTNPPVVTAPSIFIDKDDSTPGTPDTDGNDIQKISENGTATFTVRFVNNGNEALKTVVITDQYAPDCNRTSTQTAALYGGGTTANFDVGETFSYVCSKTNVTSSTFPNNRNTASITGVGVTSAQNVADSDITEIFIVQNNPDISIEKNDTDNLDDEQEIDEDGTAEFSVKVTNNGDESLRNVVITDELSPDCERSADETKALIRKVGNKDSNFDPGEKFAYICEEDGVTEDTFPDEKNTVCVDAVGIESDEDVNDCDNTRITLIIPEEQPSVCENIESSEGEFGGAPFRTEITCQTTDSSSTCQIEVTKDGEIIHTYEDCVKDITFSTPGDYSVACIVDDEASSDCELGITVEAMTEVETGTKILLTVLFSLAFAGLGTYIYARRRKLS